MNLRSLCSPPIKICLPFGNELMSVIVPHRTLVLNRSVPISPPSCRSSFPNRSISPSVFIPRVHEFHLSPFSEYHFKLKVLSAAFFLCRCRSLCTFHLFDRWEKSAILDTSMLLVKFSSRIGILSWPFNISPISETFALSGEALQFWTTKRNIFNQNCKICIYNCFMHQIYFGEKYVERRNVDNNLSRNCVSSLCSWRPVDRNPNIVTGCDED